MFFFRRKKLSFSSFSGSPSAQLWREEFLHGEHCVQFTTNASLICAFIHLKIFWHGFMWFVKFSNEPGDYCCRVLRWSTLRKVKDYCRLRFPQGKWLNFYLDVNILLLIILREKSTWGATENNVETLLFSMHATFPVGKRS